MSDEQLIFSRREDGVDFGDESDIKAKFIKGKKRTYTNVYGSRNNAKKSERTGLTDKKLLDDELAAEAIEDNYLGQQRHLDSRPKPIFVKARSTKDGRIDLVARSATARTLAIIRTNLEQKRSR